MEHRHINIKNNEWGVAIVHSIWESGSEEDICTLIREVKKIPKPLMPCKGPYRILKYMAGRNSLRCIWRKFMAENDAVYWQRWQKLLDAAANIQGLLPGSVMIVGSAAAIHFKHRKGIQSPFDTWG